MNAHSVLCAAIDSNAYRSAVATIINDIERSGHTLIDIAERIDVSLGTISNAKNKKTDLSPEFLARLGKIFGAAYINPYLALFDAQSAPIKNRATRDVLPIVNRVSLKISEARDPAGPGGATEVPQERLGYLRHLKEMQHEVGCLIREIEAA